VTIDPDPFKYSLVSLTLLHLFAQPPLVRPTTTCSPNNHLEHTTTCSPASSLLNVQGSSVHILYVALKTVDVASLVHATYKLPTQAQGELTAPTAVQLTQIHTVTQCCLFHFCPCCLPLLSATDVCPFLRLDPNHTVPFCAWIPTTLSLSALGSQPHCPFLRLDPNHQRSKSSSPRQYRLIEPPMCSPCLEARRLQPGSGQR
jgi:hypothetical protein